MMTTEHSRPTKIKPQHLERLAIVYVRQSCPQQLIRHPESAEVQAKLKDRAVQWGWRADRVRVLNGDQGRSGKTTVGRDDFAWLISEIAAGRIGLVVGLQINRLSREDDDTARLIKACGLFDALLGDLDGVYDSQDFNDWMVLKIKSLLGGMELYQQQQRMQTARLNKAQRGEWLGTAPVGYVVGPNRKLQFDPDEQIQAFVRLIFDRYESLGSCRRLMQFLAKEGILVPRRSASRHSKGQIEFYRPYPGTIRNMLSHPVYAGAYTWARRKTDPKRAVPGRRGSGRTLVAPQECEVFLKDNHDAYISWSQYEANLERRKKQRLRGPRPGPARETVSLAAGLLVCGRCGYRMQTRYTRKLRYVCERRSIECGAPTCQTLVGEPLDRLVSEQVLLALQPARLQLSLHAARECEREWLDLDKQWKLRLERAQQDVHRAERQYHAVEPENRLVARTLERNWEAALLAERKLSEEYDRFRESRSLSVSPEQREQIESLITNFPQLWNSSQTSLDDKRQIVRLLLDRITVSAPPDSQEVTIQFHWVGGSITHHTFTRRVHTWQQVEYHEKLSERILKWHSHGWTATKIAQQLNREGFQTTRGTPFARDTVRKLLSRLKALPK